MEYRLTINLDNAAFDPEPEAGVARILAEIAHRLQNGDSLARKVRDVNGNTVGCSVVRDAEFEAEYAE